ncbi:hypothetical protein LJC72_06435 [Bacteroides sp. OttesenSCG-928-D19]|nr:hypothetical protein [Bacteroides sp. OttesenSCG-928-D19]
MGIVLFNDHLGYLIDDGIISICPYQLFEIIDNRLPHNWFFNNLTSEDSAFPFIETIWGYYELCFEKNYYEKLIVNMEEEASRIYFRRKIELEKELL